MIISYLQKGIYEQSSILKEYSSINRTLEDSYKAEDIQHEVMESMKRKRVC